MYRCMPHTAFLSSEVLRITVRVSMQLFQEHVLHMLPFGALSKFNVVDTCVGILISGSFMLYFGTSSNAVL